MDINSSKSTLRAALCAGGIICMLCLGGCSDSAGSGPDPVWGTNDAGSDFQTATDRPPTAKTLCAMADILATQGRDSECEYVLRRILQEHPKYLPAYNSLAELQMRQGLTSEAIETLQIALGIHPDDPTMLNNLGMCRIVRGEYEDALEMFTKAAGKMPENAKYRANMAVALGLMGREEESLALFSQVMSEDKANHNLTVLREARNMPEQASATQSQAPDIE
ncbi:MAG: tetratricopeptide repeat protein [Planctomycetota bacterium]